MVKVLLLYVNAGYGHRKVAEAAAQELKARNGKRLEVEIFDALEKTNFLFKNSYSELYFRMVKHTPWLWALFFSISNSAYVYPVIAPLRTAWNWLQSFSLRKYLGEKNYDYIIFTHFFPAEVSATMKRNGKIQSKLVTIVTDVIPHRVWVNPGTDYFWVMSDESAKALTEYGVSAGQIHIKGIPVSADFTRPIDCAAVRKKLDLDQNRLTILFSSGSFGMGPTEEVLDTFSQFGDRIQVIVVCGQNKYLLQRLNSRQFPFKIRIFGFVDNMPELMSASDLLVAKPGGATMCESLVKHLPMIMTSPIPGQETHNAEWLTAHGAAFQIKDAYEIKDIVKRVVQNPQVLDSVRSAIKTIAKPQAAADLADSILSGFKS